MIDASIPLQVKQFDLAGAVQNGQNMRLNQMRLQDHQEESDNRKRLSTLVPQAMHGDKAALEQLYAVDPQTAMRLDAQQKAEAATKVADLTQAVRWADTPDKWEQVINHYAGEGVDLSQYRGHFENREQALMSLGKLGQYLSEAPKQEFHNVMPGAAGVTFDPHTGKVNMAVQANPGTAPQGAPAGTLTDEDIARMDGGQTGQPSGPFPR